MKFLCCASFVCLIGVISAAAIETNSAEVASEVTTEVISEVASEVASGEVSTVASEVASEEVSTVATEVASGEVSTVASEVASDDDAKEIINEILSELMVLDEKSYGAMKIFLDSIDRDCMINNYQKREQIIGKNLLIFGGITVSCSNSLDNVFGFLFDFLFSFNNLVDLFKNVEPYKSILNKFNCYLHHAAEEKFIDPTAFPQLDFNLTVITEEECKENISAKLEMLKAAIPEALEFPTMKQKTRDFLDANDKCFEKEFVKFAEDLFFKYAVLLPAAITGEQKVPLKESFLEFAKESFEKVVLCSAPIKQEDQSQAQDEDQSQSQDKDQSQAQDEEQVLKNEI
jgi:hypothetical protein